jgi:putative nucleotidyltransferase with HDIG domain
MMSIWGRYNCGQSEAFAVTTCSNPKLDNTRISQIIREELEELPTLPIVVVRIMETANDPTASATTLKNIIMTDQAFAAKVLKLVNSPYYGFSGKISTITHAIVVLGFGTVRNLATSLGVSGEFRASKGPSPLDLGLFWTHSVACACAAAVIARHKNVSAKVIEEVFIGALLHDIGKLFLNRYFPEQYAVTLKYARAAKCSVLDAGKHSLGISHSAIGGYVALKWNLPPATAAMVTLHHSPGLADKYMETVSIVHAADYLVRSLKAGNAGDDTEPTLSPDVEDWLMFLPNVWKQLETETARKFEDASGLVKSLAGR